MTKSPPAFEVPPGFSKIDINLASIEASMGVPCVHVHGALGSVRRDGALPDYDGLYAQLTEYVEQLRFTLALVSHLPTVVHSRELPACHQARVCLSADAWSGFEEEGVFDEASRRRYTEEVLELGASRPTPDSFTAFHRRAPLQGAPLHKRGIPHPLSQGNVIRK